ncbi:MAG: hypothetical protein CMIDDMOC_00604 [Sodalis sp. Fle]|nr:MAG: hypothetical protein CMIDDMOC_00604 [Sodalis sp. Fle]
MTIVGIYVASISLQKQSSTSTYVLSNITETEALYTSLQTHRKINELIPPIGRTICN